MINWKVRLHSKEFWIAMVPAVLVLIQQAAAIMGFQMDLSELQSQLLAAVNTVFVILSLVGIAVDVTTPGIGDSELTMAKTRPTAITAEEAVELLRS